MVCSEPDTPREFTHVVAPLIGKTVYNAGDVDARDTTLSYPFKFNPIKHGKFRSTHVSDEQIVRSSVNKGNNGSVSVPIGAPIIPSNLFAGLLTANEMRKFAHPLNANRFVSTLYWTPVTTPGGIASLTITIDADIASAKSNPDGYLPGGIVISVVFIKN
jgi:hypothetical protein